MPRPEQQHRFKYVQPDPTVRADEAGYRVEDGIVIDALDKAPAPNSRKFGEFTRWTQESANDRLREELAWAARSGPVTVRRISKAVA